MTMFQQKYSERSFLRIFSLVSFDLWPVLATEAATRGVCKTGVLKIFRKFHRKTPTLESLFNTVGGLSGHFEEHLWTTASVANTIPRLL